MPSDGAPFCVELFWAMPLLLLQPGWWPGLLLYFGRLPTRTAGLVACISFGFRPFTAWSVALFCSALDRYGVVGGLYFSRLSTVYGLVGGLVLFGSRPFTAWSVACTFFYISLASPEPGSARTTIASYSNRRWTGDGVIGRWRR